MTSNKTHHEIREHLLQLEQCGLVFDVLSVLCKHTQTHAHKQRLIYVRLKRSSALSAQTDLGGEDGLPRLGDHVELLDGGGQVAGGAQVRQAHEAALGPHVVMRPVVPLVRSVRGCERESSGFKTGTSSIGRIIVTQRLLLVCQHLLRRSHVRDNDSRD